MVSGHCRKALPAKATRPSRSDLACCIRSSAASFARASRLGAMSSASMLFEVSMATTMSSPRCFISSQSKPHCGRASARIRQTTARTRQAARIFCRVAEMPTVKAGNSRAWMNCVSNCCRDAPRPPEEGQQRRRNRPAAARACGGWRRSWFNRQSAIGDRQYIHGSLLQNVWRNSSSSSSRPRPGEKQPGEQFVVNAGTSSPPPRSSPACRSRHRWPGTVCALSAR